MQHYFGIDKNLHWNFYYKLYRIKLPILELCSHDNITLPIEWQDLRRKQIHLYFLQNKSYALPKTSWFKFLHILKYVCHTSVVHMLWKLWSRYFFFVEAKFPWKLTFHQFWWQDFFFFQNISTIYGHIWQRQCQKFNLLVILLVI